MNTRTLSTLAMITFSLGMTRSGRSTASPTTPTWRSRSYQNYAWERLESDAYALLAGLAAGPEPVGAWVHELVARGRASGRV